MIHYYAEAWPCHRQTARAAAVKAFQRCCATHGLVMKGRIQSRLQEENNRNQVRKVLVFEADLVPVHCEDPTVMRGR